MKVMMILSYDGSKFRGFQIQRDGSKSVANTLEEIFKRLGIDSKFNASGRTDSFVHAINQVIDIDLPPYWSDLVRLKTILNRHLHPHIHIKQIREVDESFHARYSAKKRQYRYIIKESEFCVFGSQYYLFYKHKIDIELISRAVKLFEGRHDFKGFMKQGSDIKSTIREIFKARVYRYGDYVVFSFVADGFLRSQIRMMVAFLLMINEGKRDLDDLLEQINLKKIHSRVLAEPNGLYLTRIWY